MLLHLLSCCHLSYIQLHQQCIYIVVHPCMAVLWQAYLSDTT
jgi:hypothetical protein